MYQFWSCFKLTAMNFFVLFYIALVTFVLNNCSGIDFVQCISICTNTPGGLAIPSLEANGYLLIAINNKTVSIFGKVSIKYQLN